MMKGSIIEIFSSFQGEGGSIKGSCFGRRQIFVRLAGCNLVQGEFGTSGCVWCDSKKSHETEPEHCLVEKSPGLGEFFQIPNPLRVDSVVDYIKGLITPDTHSISFTGGEPLYQSTFLSELLKKLHGGRIKVFLETNGSLPEKIHRIADFVDIASVDIKESHSNAAIDWEELLQAGLKTIRLLKQANCVIYAKMVVSQKTTKDEIKKVATKLKKENVGLVLQYLWKNNLSDLSPENEHMYALSEAAAEEMGSENVCISFQAHKLLSIL